MKKQKYIYICAFCRNVNAQFSPFHFLNTVHTKYKIQSKTTMSNSANKQVI